MYDYAIYIGRFQPWHNGHLKTAQGALELAKNLIVLVGSATSARTVKNPFTAEERREMILGSLDNNKNITVLNLRDYYYSDNLWVAEVNKLVQSVAGYGKKICLVGTNKDESSYYLKLFPQFDFIEQELEGDINATDIRTTWLRDSTYYSYVNHRAPQASAKKLFEMDIAVLNNLISEYKYINDYKDSWAGSPYPPIFVTSDAVVTCCGHILLIERKDCPGKGLWALPGGFLGQNESLLEGCIRELKEETKIKVPVPVLLGSIVSRKTFDHPGRSLRGRVITEAFLINLNEKELPKVKASSDAKSVKWIPIHDALEMPHLFFEDHHQILEVMLAQGDFK